MSQTTVWSCGVCTTPCSSPTGRFEVCCRSVSLVNNFRLSPFSASNDRESCVYRLLVLLLHSLGPLQRTR